MAPETHTRYRVQRLIRMGEWLERNKDAFMLASEVINEAHDTLIDPPEDTPCSDIVEQVGFQQLHAVTTLRTIVNDLRFDVPTRRREARRLTSPSTTRLPGATSNTRW